MTIDIHTLALILSIANLLQVIALFVQSRLAKNNSGLGWWAAGSSFVMLGFAFNFLRDNPAWGQFSIVANNFFFVAGMALFYTGAMRFFSQRVHKWRLIALCTISTLIAIYFTYIINDLAIRRVNISIALAIMAFLNARAFFYFKTHAVTGLAHFLSSVFALYGLFFFVRALTPFGIEHAGEIFTASLTQSATYLVTLIASSLWTYAMIILVNQRTNAENKESKDNLELIFNTSPDAVLITRLNDGYCVSVNDGFTAITGYTRSEVTGRSVLDVNLWNNPADRQKLVNILREKGVCENFEAVFQRKGGELINGLVSARIINLLGEPHLISVTRDISEQKRAADIIRESEEKHRALFADSPDAYLIIMDGKFVDCNQATEVLLRGNRSRIIGQSPDLLSPEFQPDGRRSAEAAQEKIDLAVKTGTINFEWVHRRLDGTDFFVEVSLAPTQLGGRPAQITIWRDISERKQAEEALRESEQNYRTLADSGQAMVWVSGNDRKCYYFNTVWLKFTGLTLEQAIINGWELCVHADDAQRSQDLYFSAFNQREPYRTEYRLLRFDGEYRWMLDEGSPRYDSKGNFIGFIGHSLDITDRKQVEEALEESKNQINQLLQNTDQGIYGIALNGACTFINKSGLAMLGYQLEECLGENMHSLIHHSHVDGSPYPVDDCPIFQVKLTGKDARLENEVLWRKDGTCFPSEYSAHPILEKGEIRGAVVTFSDISERKSAELALQESAEELKLFNRQLEDSIANANEMAVQAVLAESMIREREANLNEAQHLARVGSWKYIVATGEIAWSKEMFSIFGLDPAQGVQDWSEVRKFVYPDDLPRYDRTFRRAIIQNKPYELEIRAMHADGSLLWLLLTGGKGTSEFSPGAEWVTGTIQDITERKRTEEALRETNAYLENLINYANAPIIVWDPQFHITRFNHAFERLTGRSEAEVLGQSLEILFPPELARNSMALIHTTLTGERWETVEIKILHQDDTVRTVLWNSATLFSADGKTPIATIAQGQDITERKRLEEKLHQQATTDGLTGVTNRRHLLELAHVEIRRAIRVNRPLTIALIDIDHFKHINDTYGHSSGDLALVTFTNLCLRSIRDIDVFARFGGDEFALMLPETNLEQAYAVIERIRASIASKPLILDGQPATITISSGIADLSNDLETFDTLLSRADQALYLAKQAGRNKVVVFKI